ncbi:MAG: methylmalonyl Co-A mutase-associated GTPase MeaB [Rhodospirillales bacterium]|nr:methylmalonyl Co-A mutase-associated GTPase MeaB [Rhodospirillales bacterium]
MAAAAQAAPATIPRSALTDEDYARGVLSGDRAMLGRAITVIESSSPRHRQLAQDILHRLLPHTGRAHRIGITGVPGAGKSTFIEAFGTYLIRQGLKVAVLAVDPSSPVSGGSILGDKTRMAELSQEPNAFIRPSPSGGTLGGVTRTTRQTMVVCDAAGYDVILVETVGAGQSEVAVSDLTDVFVVLMLPGAGDELQGIKKGVLEIADMIVVNKADGGNEIRAKQAAVHYRNALHIIQPRSASWSPPVLMCSAIKNIGVDAVWGKLVEHKEKLSATGEFQNRRQQQRVKAMWTTLQDRVMTDIKSHHLVVEQLPELKAQLLSGNLTVTRAVDRILELFHQD